MEKTKNTLGVIFLIILLLTFVVGGYFAMRYLTKENPINNNNETHEEKEVDLRKDKSKDYIYYENLTDIIASEEIEARDAYFNFESMDEVNNTLQGEMAKIKKSAVYTEDVTEEIPEEARENEEGIYSLDYREYVDYTYRDYVSLVVMDYHYDIVNGSRPMALKSYVVSKKDGKLVTEEDLLKTFNATMDDVKNKVKERITDTQTLNEDIDIEGTMNDFNTYALYVNKLGKLEITFVVKSTESNYNDNVVISD